MFTLKTHTKGLNLLKLSLKHFEITLFNMSQDKTNTLQLIVSLNIFESELRKTTIVTDFL